MVKIKQDRVLHGFVLKVRSLFWDWFFLFLSFTSVLRFFLSIFVFYFCFEIGSFCFCVLLLFWDLFFMFLCVLLLFWDLFCLFLFFTSVLRLVVFVFVVEFFAEVTVINHVVLFSVLVCIAVLLVALLVFMGRCSLPPLPLQLI